MDTPESSTEEAAEPADSTYTVKVDGSESEVTLSELQQGYQRQADYTRKTQELASERQRLEQAEAIVSALEADPQGALTALSTAFGIEDNRSSSPTDEWEEDPDPQEQRIASLEATVAQQTRTSRQTALEKEVNVIMLDNMAIDMIRESVKLINGWAKVEISGCVTLEKLDEISRTGADFVSVGALTHSAPSVDISMNIITP